MLLLLHRNQIKFNEKCISLLHHRPTINYLLFSVRTIFTTSQSNLFLDSLMRRGCALFSFLFSAICGGLLLSSGIAQAFGGGNRGGVDDVSKHPRATNALLPITPRKYPTELVAALDGRIYLVDVKLRKILWSFPSGMPIYSSYQALPYFETTDNDQASELHDFYIDIGDDWGLYVHGHGYKKVKLPSNVEELIKLTPVISSDGGVLLGSKNTTVFLVEAKSGRIIYAFRSDDHSTMGVHSAEENSLLPKNSAEEWDPTVAMDMEKDEQFLYVTRTDYALKYISRKTAKELWYLKFADFEASFLCQEVGSSLIKGVADDKELSWDCQGKAVVYRIRDHSSLEHLFGSDTHLEGQILSLPPTKHSPVLQPPDKLPELCQDEDLRSVLSLSLPEKEKFGILSLPVVDPNEAYNIAPPEVLAWSRMWYLIIVVASLACIVVFLSQLGALAVGKKDIFNKQQESKLQAGMPKMKKSRKLSKSKNNVGAEASQGDTFSYPVEGCINGRRIGSLFITSKEIGKGSNGTIVLEGTYDGRPVAVKRLVRTHHDVASKEFDNLIASDYHPNIVRLYGMEHDQDFVYLSLELCNCSLYDLIYICSVNSQDQTINKFQDQNLFKERSISLHSLIDKNKDFELWKANGYPSAQLLNIMRDIVSGVAHLHELGIIHRDLKPQNVLIIKQGSVRAKLSDMGISKRLPMGVSSLTRSSTGGGSSGWQAPEQLRHERQTRSTDLFSLGCLLFFCLTGGQHPFGDSFERDMNVVNNHKDMFLIESFPEAVDLISHLLDPEPSLRPKASDVLHHPLFWSAEMRLSFLRDASDRVQLEDRESESELINALENTAPVALGGRWDEKMDIVFINDIGRYRRYKFDSVCDLLRVIRNKLNHYRELSQEIQGILGHPPQGFNSYFSSRFPGLLIEVYKVLRLYCGQEEFLGKYF